MKRIFIAVTGPLNSGKSTLCRYLKKNFALQYISTDDIVKKLYQRNAAGYRALKKLHHPEFFYKNSAINKKKLAHYIFSNQSYRHQIENLIQPLAFRELKKIIRAPLNPRILIESVIFPPDIINQFNILIELKCTLQSALNRNTKKYPSKLFKKIFSSYQKPSRIPDYIINNNNSILNLKKDIQKIAKSLYLEKSRLK